MSKYTQADIKRIANAMRRQRDNKPDRPYNLMTGAGCSKSAGIPLAPKLVEEIKEKYKYEIEHRLGEDCDDDYGKCMSVLSSNEVKGIIQPHLDRAGVNWGHLAIAALMKAGYIGRVLTFNFDAVLAHACGLLVHYPATYDFVSGVSTSTDHIAPQAILHLHGQGHSLAILNSKDETKPHAENLKPLLEDTFSKYPIIVAGYSGKSDAVFKVIKEIYKGAERLHWTDISEECGSHISSLLNIRPNASEYLGGADSDLFFMELAKELECWPPKLFKNPYAHLLEELSPIVDYPGTDTDILSNIKQKLTTKSEEAEVSEDNANDLIIKGDWDAVEEKVGDARLTGDGKSLLAIALKSKADSKRRQSNKTNTIEALQNSCNLYERAATLNPKLENLWFSWGNTLSELAELKENPSMFEQSFEKYKAALVIKPDNHQALNNWGNALSILARLNQDPDMFEQSVEKYKAALDIKPDKQEALYNWGNALSGLAQLNKDPDMFEQSFEKYKAALVIKPDCHSALNNWGTALLHLHALQSNSQLLENAENLLLRAKELNPDTLYNLACLYALQNKIGDAKAALLHCESKGTLAKLEHLEKDTDMDNLREEEWFKDLLTRLREKEAS